MSIRQLHARLTRDESGLGLTEVIVALLIFAIISVGMAQSLVAMTRLTFDATNRETATNLAAAEIDRVQAQKDAFNVHDSVATSLIDGVTYTVTTKVGWVPASGATGNCGTGGGNLQYKRINVLVTWPGQYLKSPVRADSALAPASRISDPTAGTILVSVIDVNGKGNQGITVSATKTSGGPTITDTIDPTDVDGCSFILKAPPGNYNLTITKSGYLDTTHAISPVTKAIVVSAGASTPVSFQFDAAATFNVKYAANSTKPYKLPTNLDISYSGLLTNLTEAAATTRKFFPWSAGYQGLAGNTTTCAAVDPENWVANATMKDGVGAPAAQVAPGNSGPMPVPMGVVEMKMPSSADAFVTAVQQNVPGDGNPGCAGVTTYKFASQTKNTTVDLALPYGTYKIYTGGTLGSTSTQVTTNISIVDGIVSVLPSGALQTGLAAGGTIVAGIVTLDPRQPK